MANPYKSSSDCEKARLFHSISILFRNERELMEFLFSQKTSGLRVPTKVLLKESKSLSEQDMILIRIALDYWNRKGSVRLSDMIDAWNRDDWIRFIYFVSCLEKIKFEVIDLYTLDLI